MRKQQLQDLTFKKNTLMCSNVMEINQQGCSFPIGLNVEKEMYNREKQSQSPQDSDLDDFILDEDALEMLGDLALDEDIEDDVQA